MRIKHRFSFSVDDSTKEVVDFLEENKIKHKVGSGIPILTLYIFEDNKNWANLECLMKKHNKNSISERVYSKKEIDSAEWLRIRTKWRSEYPQPEDGGEYKKITYDDSAYCSSCGCGLVQKDSFRLKKSPKWGKKNFLMLNWVESELFVTDEVANQLMDYDIKGLNVLSVIDHKTNEPLENVKQLKISNKLKLSMATFDVGITKENNCTQCQSIKYLLSGRSPLVFKREVFVDSADIVKSGEVFGDGLVCLEMILISKRMYDSLSKHGWHKELVIEPLILI
jgi:hypothetical protein